MARRRRRAASCGGVVCWRGVGSLPLSRASGNVGVSHCSICSASVAWVVCPALQPSHALQRVRGVRWEGRNSPSKNTLALAEASASAAKSRVIMFAVVRCNTGVARVATAVCEGQTSTRRDGRLWRPTPGVGDPRVQITKGLQHHGGVVRSAENLQNRA